VEVEDVSRVGLTSRRTTKKEGHLTICDSLLGEIVIEDHGMLAVVSEVLTHGSASVRGKELQRSRVRGSGGDDDAVTHGVGLLESADKLSDGGSLLADTHIDAVKHLLRGLGLLVDDGVNSDGSLAGLTITNDELTLTSADRNEGIYGLESSGHRLVHRLARDDARGLDLCSGAQLGVNSTLSIDRLPETIDNSAEQLGSHGHIHNGSSALDSVAL
jgi:hypothetical protein